MTRQRSTSLYIIMSLDQTRDALVAAIGAEALGPHLAPVLVQSQDATVVQGYLYPSAVHGAAAWPICGECGEPLSALLTIDGAILRGVADDSVLQVFTCQDCRGFKAFANNINVRAIPKDTPEGPVQMPFEHSPVPLCFRETVMPPDSETCSDALDIDLSVAHENALHIHCCEYGPVYVGGHPVWEQGPRVPKCRACKVRMEFIAGITAKDDLVDLGDDGNAQIYCCPSCNCFAYQYQSG
ncbi:hypothetical protein KIPB_004796 [Kipferlia bialata]|uniref:Uncharacterized protein n=1 Tax=Kipferlia bialata TaxID=797122 RepID=A0A9K3CW95_9EUKA|nr:hypothetical protein KIPB_004796 [Kipferlia bialata]|eukprot:g4796.t1